MFPHHTHTHLVANFGDSWNVIKATKEMIEVTLATWSHEIESPKKLVMTNHFLNFNLDFASQRTVGQIGPQSILFSSYR